MGIVYIAGLPSIPTSAPRVGCLTSNIVNAPSVANGAFDARPPSSNRHCISAAMSPKESPVERPTVNVARNAEEATMHLYRVGSTFAGIASVTALAMFGFSISAVGQIAATPPGTIEFSFGERRSAGRLEGCEVSFRQVHFDNIYRNGGLVMLSGGFAYWQIKGKQIAFSLKFSAHDIDIRNQKPVYTPFNPPVAYLILQDKLGDKKFFSTWGLENVKTIPETGGFLAAYTDMKVLVGFDVDSNFRIGYKRQGGNSDVITEISVPTPNQKQWSDAMAFSKCVIELMENAE